MVNDLFNEEMTKINLTNVDLVTSQITRHCFVCWCMYARVYVLACTMHHATTITQWGPLSLNIITYHCYQP